MKISHIFSSFLFPLFIGIISPLFAFSQTTIDSSGMIRFTEIGNERDYSTIWPGTVKEIPAYQFKDDSELKSIKIEEGVTEIGEYCFLGCTSLEKVSLPSTLKKIGEGAFRECKSLKKLIIPDGIEVIPSYMCYWDTSLDSIYLPQSVKDIGRSAFAYCHNLKLIQFPDSLTHIGPNAFNECRSLKKVEIPDSMEELESYAFADCSSLERIKLPANNKMLGELLLIGCVNLKEIEIKSKEPPTFDCNSPLFDPSEKEMYRRCRLIIDSESEKKYSEAPVWELFFKD